MKILIVSSFFPPYAPMAGTRVSKFAKYLYGRGHDIRVLAAKDTKYPPLLGLEIPPENVVYTPYTDINEWPQRAVKALLGPFRGRAGRGDANGAGNPPDATDQGHDRRPRRGRRSRLRSRLQGFYSGITNIPDAQIGWHRHAVRSGRKLLESWRADLIYATVPPHTGLLVAHKLSRIFAIPWVAEFRDLWVDHPYYSAPAWRRAVERRLQNRILSSCAGFVTVTETWTGLLRQTQRAPVALVFNGFDADDYSADCAARPGDRERLSLLYAGSIYAGTRDPTKLFEALRILGTDAGRIKVHFYVPDPGVINALAESLGVGESVVAHRPVPHADIVGLQRSVDVLLLLRWDDPREHGVIAGKLFEYIGAGRPILSVGAEEGEAADIIRRWQLGLVSNDAEELAEQLRRWLDSKSRTGKLPPPPAAARDVFSRSVQFGTLESFLTSLVDGSGR